MTPDTPADDEQAPEQAANAPQPRAKRPRARKAAKAPEAAAGDAGSDEGETAKAAKAQKAKAKLKAKAPRASKPQQTEAEAAEGEPEAALEETAAPAQKRAPRKPAAKAAASAKRASKPEKPAKRARRGTQGAPQTARRRTVRARARFVRTSARKARMVCVHLRGKTVQEARAILAFTPREVARDWSKLLESAVANAESNHELLEDDLIVREAYADEGPTIKRFRPRAMGRATPIRKRTSHLTITLTPRAEPANTKRQA